jgi:hypothetical protein
MSTAPPIGLEGWAAARTEVRGKMRQGRDAQSTVFELYQASLGCLHQSKSMHLLSIAQCLALVAAASFEARKHSDRVVIPENSVHRPSYIIAEGSHADESGAPWPMRLRSIVSGEDADIIGERRQHSMQTRQGFVADFDVQIAEVQDRKAIKLRRYFLRRDSMFPPRRSRVCVRPSRRSNSATFSQLEAVKDAPTELSCAGPSGR